MLTKLGIFSLFVFMSIAAVFFLLTKKGNDFLPLTAFETRAVRLGKAPFTVFIADTPQKRAQGLMNVRKLAAGRGMLFVFDQPQKLSFYNKNTLIPLDLLWIKHGVVEEISSLPPIKGDNPTFVHPNEPVDNVIELNAGDAERNNIKAGDRMEVESLWRGAREKVKASFMKKIILMYDIH